MKTEILAYINKVTHRENLSERTTKEVAINFDITIKEAYRLCSELAKEKLITKLDPVNGDNFSCCGWIRNND